jgi:hypothetical protein
MVFLLNVDFAIRTGLTLLLAGARDQFPARNREIQYGRTILADFLAAVADFPTRSNGEKFPDPGHIQSVIG